jgi:GT2 family glycosyltransferase
MLNRTTMREIDVVLVSNAATKNLEVVTTECLDSLFKSEDEQSIKFNSFVIESNKDVVYPFSNTKTVHPSRKFGYHKFLNIGIQLGAAEFVCICNNDLYFDKLWASEILKVFDDFPDISSACPMCTFHHKKAKIVSNSGIYEGYTIRRELVGWCIVFRRSILNKIGLLDERFTFWYSDNDFARTLVKFGLKHVLVTSSFVNHLESKTLKSKSDLDQIILTTKDKFYFEYKWLGRSLISYKFSLFKFALGVWIMKLTTSALNPE